MIWLPGDRPLSNPRATRSVVMGRHGMLATSHPLASAAGVQVLVEGGNAVDAAVTAAATLSVVEPTMTGIGGDLFAIVHDGHTGTVSGLNASGRAPAAACLTELGPEGSPIPPYGILSVTVPGAVDGWGQLLRRHGSVPLARALAPAIGYARDGFAVTEVVADQWRSMEPLLANDAAAAKTFLPHGRAPRASELFTNRCLATTLERLAIDGTETLYRGELAEEIASDSQSRGGWLDEGDLAGYHADWVEPLRTDFYGREILELPPNTQGITALEILNLIGRDDLWSLGHNTAAYLHLLIEAVRIAFADRAAYIADPDAVPPEVVDHLISKGYAAARRGEIESTRTAHEYQPWRGHVPGDGTAPRVGSGDTVYLAAADRDGTVVSLIQSLFGTFGSGIVVGDTGIALQNRASLFSTNPLHPNCLGPGKRPLHTLIPACVLESGHPSFVFGVMGTDMQAQGHAQVLTNLFVFGMNVQEAGEAARACWTGNGIAAESGIPHEVLNDLVERGHHVTNESSGFGGFQGIRIDLDSGVLMGGSDPRKDGLALAY